MSLGLHNVSSETRVRLAERQADGIPLGTDEDRRRFWAKVRVADSDTECWMWTASTTAKKGGTYRYGQFMLASVHGRRAPIGAHRACWELTFGAIPDGGHVCHSCDNPLCVNPFHLFLGTHTDNMRDAAAKGRLPRTREWLQKVTDAQCDEIVALYRSGMTQQAIGERFGIHKVSVSYIVNGKRRQNRRPSRMEQAS